MSCVCFYGLPVFNSIIVIAERLICSQCLQRQSMWRILNNQICRRKIRAELCFDILKAIHTSYLFPMFAEAIHVKDIEQSNLQEKNRSWVMLWNGGYIHKELANTLGEHLFSQGPKLPLLYHAICCWKLNSMPMYFMVLYHCVRINIFVWDLLFLYIYNLDFDLMRFCY